MSKQTLIGTDDGRKSVAIAPAMPLGGSSRRGKQAQILADAKLLVTVQKRIAAIDAQERIRERRKNAMDRSWAPKPPKPKHQRGRWAPWSPGFAALRTKPGTCVVCGRERCHWDPDPAQRRAARQSKGKAYVG